MRSQGNPLGSNKTKSKERFAQHRRDVNEFLLNKAAAALQNPKKIQQKGFKEWVTAPIDINNSISIDATTTAAKTPCKTPLNARTSSFALESWSLH